MKQIALSRIAGFLLSAAAALVLAASGASAQALGGSFKGFQVSKDKPMAIESDQLDVDDTNALATFTGNVSVMQDQTLLKTTKLIVFYAKKPAPEEGATPVAATAEPGALPGSNDDIERLEATGKVYIKTATQIATAEKADINLKDQVVVLTGNVVVTEGESVAKGERLTIQMETGVAQFGGGRIKILSTPSQAPAGQ